MAKGAEQNVTALTLTKMCLGADYYSNISPAVSRSQMNDVYRIKDHLETVDPSGTSCPFCGQIFRPDNHTVRIQPRLRLNKKIRKLLKNQKRLKKHSFQAHLLENYKAGFNMMIKKCNACGKSDKFKLYSRAERLQHVQSKPTSPPDSEPVKLSKSQKKKQKAKRKQKQKPGFSVGDTPSNEKILDASAVSDSVPSSSSHPRNQAHSLKMVDDTRTQESLQLPKKTSVKSGTINPLVVSNNEHHTTSLLNSQSKANKRLKGKKSFNTLQKMLNDVQMDKAKANSPGSALQNFLGSLG